MQDAREWCEKWWPEHKGGTPWRNVCNVMPSTYELMEAYAAEAVRAERAEIAQAFEQLVSEMAEIVSTVHEWQWTVCDEKIKTLLARPEVAELLPKNP